MKRDTNNEFFFFHGRRERSINKFNKSWSPVLLLLVPREGMSIKETFINRCV